MWPTAAGELFGRAEELERLTAVEQAATGGAAVLISGQVGIGKTMLLEAALGRVSAGTQILRAAGVEFEANVRYSGLNQLLLPLSADLEQLTAVDRTALKVALGFGRGPVPATQAVSAAVFALLTMVAAERPVLLVVDDLHWLDRASTAILGEVAQRLTGVRVGFLATYRSDEETTFDVPGLPTIELGPLDETTALLLVRTRFPALSARMTPRLITEAQGNPLALVEMAAAVQSQEGAARPVLASALPVAGRLQQLYGSRVSGLPEATRQLLLVAALAGGDGFLAVRHGDSHARGKGALAPADQAGLVAWSERSRRWEFSHPFVRSTVVTLSTPGQRQAAHRYLAVTLATDPERRAWHLAEAAAGPDEEVAALLEQVAQLVLLRGDSAGAVTALIRSAELSPRRSDRSRRLAVAAYVGADVSGDLRDVPRLLADARDIDPEFDGTLDASVAASYLLLHGDGDIATAHRLLVGTIEAHLDDAGPVDKALGEALQTLFEVCIYGVRPELWPPLDAALVRLGPRLPPTLRLTTRTLADPVRATADDLAVLDAAIAGLADETDPARIERVATVALLLDRATECSEALWRLVRNGRDGGGVASAIMALTVICMEHYGTGRWPECEQLNAEGLRLCDLHGYELLRAPLLLVQALIAAARGEEETVRRLAVETSAWATPRGVQAFQFFGNHARGLLALGRGDFESAYRQLSQISPAGTLPPHVAHAVWVILDLVESAVRSGHRAEAAGHVRALHDDDVAALSPRLALVTAVSEALVADDDDTAAASFERGLVIPGLDRWPFDLARARLAYGERLRRARATAAAREHLTAALEVFGRLGAEPWRARAAGELAATGSTRPRGEVTGPAALTPQEHKVADLAAAGLRNKEIASRLSLSPRTVGAHLRRVFQKLDVGSRGGLRDALNR